MIGRNWSDLLMVEEKEQASFSEAYKYLWLTNQPSDT